MKWLNLIIIYDIRVQDRYALALSNSTKWSKIYLYLLLQKSRKPYTYRCSKSRNFMFSCFLNHKKKFFWSEVSAVRYCSLMSIFDPNIIKNNQIYPIHITTSFSSFFQNGHVISKNDRFFRMARNIYIYIKCVSIFTDPMYIRLCLNSCIYI